MFKSKHKSRHNFKKGIDPDQARRRRNECSIQIRKNKKEEQLEKRRRMVTQAVSNGSKENSFDGNDVTPSLNNLHLYAREVNSQDESKMHHGVLCIRKLLSIEQNPPIDAVLQSGCLPRLVQLLQHPTHSILFEAAWALTNIASGKKSHTKAVVDAGAVPHFIRLMQHPLSDVMEQAIWAVGNIAGDNTRFRDMCLQQGALNPLLTACSSADNTRKSLLTTGTWAISNMCRGKPQPDLNFITPALQVLSRLIYCSYSEVISDACWALSYVSDDNEGNSRVQAVIQASVVPQIITLLGHSDANIVTPALRTIGNIVTGDDVQTNVVVSAGGIAAVTKLLDHRKPNIRKEATWAISNVLAGNTSQIEAVLNTDGVICKLFELIKRDKSDVRKEAIWAISNATSEASQEQIHRLCEMGCVNALCEAMEMHREPRMLRIMLQALGKLLKAGKDFANAKGVDNPVSVQMENCGGLDVLEALQAHDNESIYNLVVNMMQEYFGTEEVQEEDFSFTPSSDGNSFNFQINDTGLNQSFTF